MAIDNGQTQIDKNYLNSLKSELQTILDDVNKQLIGIGHSSDPSLTMWISPVDQTLSVAAGAPSFNAGKALNDALSKMGGSIHDELTWLKKVLTDMISEITTMVDSFGATESLNTESVNQLISDFQNTINDMNTPPGSQPPPSSGH